MAPKINVFGIGISLLLIFIVHILCLFAPIPVFVQLFINSICCVYIGCSLSIKLDSKSEKKPADESVETLSMKDAYMFPVYGSLVLFSLYIILKIFNEAIISTLFSVYFGFLGLLCLVNILENELEIYLPALKSDFIFKKKLEWTLIKKKTFNLELTKLNIITISIALVPTLLHFFTRNWMLNNVFGIAFSITGIEALNLPNFKVGFILLWGLFFYDIFWVYGTDVMVTVAKSIDAPIKLLFPIDLAAEAPKFSMLGLGDIVIPGIFVALCLKFDVDTYIKTTKIWEIKTRYFNFCFSGYILGIVTTFVVMVVFNNPQPALLFLVPGCCLSILGLALSRGELKKLWEYEETPAVKSVDNAEMKTN